MDRQNNQAQGESPRMIVDLKTRKRLWEESRAMTVDQPQEKIPAIPKVDQKYREGTHNDILKLMKAEKPPKDEGVFVKGKIPQQNGYTEKILKHGGFSKSIHYYEDQHNSSMSYVCKVVKAEKFNMSEVQNLCKLDYVYICKLYGLVRKNDEFHIFMEYCGYNLYTLIRDDLLVPAQIIDLTRQLCRAVDYAHNMKIIHLDIKPENICVLYTTNKIQLKLTDWGSSITDTTKVQSTTLCYASPELLYFYLCQILSSPRYDEEVKGKIIKMTTSFCNKYSNIERISTMSDSFSIGLTIFFAQTKKHLYERRTENRMDLLALSQIYSENPDAAKNLLPHETGDFLTTIIKKLVEGDPLNRSTVKQVQQKIDDYERNDYYRPEVIQDIIQPDAVSVQEFNIPNLDQLF